MEGFFASGRAVDVVLAVVALEFIFLSLRRRTRTRSRTYERVLTLAPGVCLLLALRAALTGAPWPWVAGALALSFPLHVADVVRQRL